MRRWTKWAWAVLVAAMASAATGQGPASPTGQIPAAATDEALDRLLAEWDERIDQRKSVSVAFDRTDRSAKWGDQFLQGRAVLKAPNLACVELRKAVLDADGKPQYQKDAAGRDQLVVAPEPIERIVWTGEEVLLYEYDTRQIFVFPFVEGPRRNVFTGALFDWTLPLLSNISAAEAKRRFEMRLIQQDERTCTIAITPRQEMYGIRGFRTGYVTFDKVAFLPSHLRLIRGDSERQEFTFRAIRADGEIADGYFHRATDLAGWKVYEHPRNSTPVPGAGWWARFLELNRPAPTQPGPAGAK